MTMKDWVGRVNETIFENKGFRRIFIEVTEFPIIYKVSKPQNFYIIYIMLVYFSEKKSDCKRHHSAVYYGL